MARLTIKSRRGGLFVFLAIILGGIALAVTAALLPRLTGEPRSWERIEQIQRENGPLFTSFGLPPGAAPYGEMMEGFTQRRGVTVWLEREYTVPGSFAEALAWYETRLTAQGWQPFDRKNWPVNGAEFCRAPWLLALHNRADFSRSRPPYHRLNLRLNWYGGMTEERCSST